MYDNDIFTSSGMLQKQRKTVTTDKTVPEEKKTQLRCTKISGSEITKHNDKNMFKAIRRNWNYE